MQRPCSNPECSELANAAGTYCDRCDGWCMPKNWSRSRDEAWLAYVDCEGIRLIPLPRAMDYDGVRHLLQELPGEGKQDGQQQHGHGRY